MDLKLDKHPWLTFKKRCGRRLVDLSEIPQIITKADLIFKSGHYRLGHPLF